MFITIKENDTGILLIDKMNNFFPLLSLMGFFIYILADLVMCVCVYIYTYRCDPYDPAGFRAWALKGGCPAIPGVLVLFNKLIESGLKVILVTGRDEETFGQVTRDNLHNQGFVGYERLIMR